MSTRTRRMVGAVSLLAGSGILLSGPGTSCSSYIGESAFVATDFCFIFDCENGILGGTFDPCAERNEFEGVGTGGVFTDQYVNEGTFLADCP